MLFDAKSFQKRIGAELFILFEYIKMVYFDEQFHYDVPGETIVDLGGEDLCEGVRNRILCVTGLFIFITLFKIADQLFEQILEDSNLKDPQKIWGFSKKIQEIKNNRSKLILPLLLVTDPNIFDKIFNFYDNNLNARNALAYREIEIINTDVNSRMLKYSIKESPSITHNIEIPRDFISDFYYKLVAIAQNANAYRIITKKTIVNEINSNPTKEIDENVLISNLGEYYKKEIRFFIDSLIPSTIIKINNKLVLKRYKTTK